MIAHNNNNNNNNNDNNIDNNNNDNNKSSNLTEEIFVFILKCLSYRLSSMSLGIDSIMKDQRKISLFGWCQKRWFKGTLIQI